MVRGVEGEGDMMDKGLLPMFGVVIVGILIIITLILIGRHDQ
jgi:hypothetical protein